MIGGGNGDRISEHNSLEGRGVVVFADDKVV